MVRLTYEDDISILEKYEDIMKRGEKVQKYCVKKFQNSFRCIQT